MRTNDVPPWDKNLRGTALTYNPLIRSILSAAKARVCKVLHEMWPMERTGCISAPGQSNRWHIPSNSGM